MVDISQAGCHWMLGPPQPVPGPLQHQGSTPCAVRTESEGSPDPACGMSNTAELLCGTNTNSPPHPSHPSARGCSPCLLAAFLMSWLETQCPRSSGSDSCYISPLTIHSLQKPLCQIHPRRSRNPILYLHLTHTHTLKYYIILSSVNSYKYMSIKKETWSHSFKNSIKK